MLSHAVEYVSKLLCRTRKEEQWTDPLGDGGSAVLYMIKFTDPLTNSFRQELFHPLHC